MGEPKEYIGTVTSKGQVTIPAEVRAVMGVRPQDKVRFRIVDGKVEMEPLAMTLEDTFGAVPPLRQPKDFAQLREVALQEHAEHVIDEMER